MPTTIQVSDKVKQVLDKIKMFERETYSEIVERLLEDNLELNEATKREIATARRRIKAGKFFTQEQVERELGL